MPTNMPAPAKAPMVRGGKNTAVIGLVSLAVGLVAGYGAGRVSTGTPLNPASTASKGGSYQDGYNAAKKKIEDAHVFPAAPTQATTLSGTVKSVGKDSLVVEVAIASLNPLDEMSAPVERTVSVTDATKLERMTQKTPGEAQKDFEKFQADLAAGKATATPPSNTKAVTISLSDLKAGDAVTLIADHDILNEKAFTATEIDLAATGDNSASANAPAAPPTIPPAP